ncbi:MAG: AMP-binding protein [Planctomycetes bacterium]|nr:AMP-binding protein [Planctomycetota bacterium]
MNHIPSVNTDSTTLVGRLRRTASAVPDKVALSDSKDIITFADLLRRASLVCERVQEATQKPHVAILLPNDSCFGVAFYGCQMAGKAVIPLSQILRPDDLKYALTDSGAELLITARSVAGLLSAWEGKRLYVEDLDWSQEPNGNPPYDGGPDHPAAILYTAGSEAKPKGVILTHGNLLANVDAVRQMARLNSDDVFLGILPMSHAFALLGTLVAPVCVGASVRYVERFIPSEIGEACIDQKATILLAVPSMYNVTLRARDLAWAAKTSLRLCVSGGEALPRGVAERFEDVFCRPLLNGYGMTETSPVISLNLPWANKPGSVGRPIPGVEVRIIDDQDRELPRDAQGEIAVRGRNVMAGYLHHPQCTAEGYTADGFFRTGDIGLIDADGYLFIKGRKKEIIIISGENVAPAEIEAVLLSHPEVADAAVIGVNHQTRGEAPVAFVIGRRFHTLTTKELREYCRERMAAFKIPRRFVISDNLPRNAAGKILKRELHKLA